MKCPKCGYPRLRYVVSRTSELRKKKLLVRQRRRLSKDKRENFGRGQAFKKNLEPRRDFRAKCSKCGWEGEYRGELETYLEEKE